MVWRVAPSFFWILASGFSIPRSGALLPRPKIRNPHPNHSRRSPLLPSLGRRSLRPNTINMVIESREPRPTNRDS
jgi:hypothetical protein